MHEFLFICVMLFCLSICLSIFVCLSICQFIYLSVCLSICQSIHLSVELSPSVCLSFYFCFFVFTFTHVYRSWTLLVIWSCNHLEKLLNTKIRKKLMTLFIPLHVIINWFTSDLTLLPIKLAHQFQKILVGICYQ